MKKVYLTNNKNAMYRIPGTDRIYTNQPEKNEDGEFVVNYIDNKDLENDRIRLQVECMCGPLRYANGEYRMLDSFRKEPRDVRNTDLAALFRDISEYAEKSSID